MPRWFLKAGSRERTFFEKIGVLGTKNWEICVLRAEILVKNKAEMQNVSKFLKWGPHERCINGKLVG